MIIKITPFFAMLLGVLFLLTSDQRINVVVSIVRPNETRGLKVAKHENVLSPMTGKKLAILIGANNYSHLHPLDNAINDLDSMKHVFEKLGFKVWECRNATKAELDTLVARVKAIPVGKYSLVTLYYSGHGCTYNRTNFLLPTDFQLQKDTFIQANAVALDTFMCAISCARQIIITDACRNTPTTRTLQTFRLQPFGSGFDNGAGLVESPINRIVIHAALEGNTASDKHPTRNNGYFTGVLLDIFGRQNCSIVFPDVFFEVMKRMSSQQTPSLKCDMPPFLLSCE